MSGAFCLYAMYVHSALLVKNQQWQLGPKMGATTHERSKMNIMAFASLYGVWPSLGKKLCPVPFVYMPCTFTVPCLLRINSYNEAIRWEQPRTRDQKWISWVFSSLYGVWPSLGKQWCPVPFVYMPCTFTVPCLLRINSYHEAPRWEQQAARDQKWISWLLRRYMEFDLVWVNNDVRFLLFTCHVRSQCLAC
jgi:hypothetical protein